MEEDLPLSLQLEAIQELRRCGKTTQAVHRACHAAQDYTFEMVKSILFPSVSKQGVFSGNYGSKLYVLNSRSSLRGLDLDLIILDEVNLDLPLPSNVEVIDSKTLLREILSNKE